MKSVKLIILSTLLVMAGLNITLAQISVDPVGLTAAFDDEDTLITNMAFTNDGDQNVNFKIKLTRPPENDNVPRRDDPNEFSVLVMKSQNDQGYGWHDSNNWVEVFDDQEGEVDMIDIEDIDDYNLDDYDIVATGEDQSASFYQSYTQNRERIEEYIDGGGLFVFFTGSNSFQQVTMPGDAPVTTNGAGGDWGDVNPEFLNDDEDGLIEGIEEDLPILTPFEYFRDDNGDENRVRIVMRGNSLNYSTIAVNQLPEDAVWYYSPQGNQSVCIIADWPFGSGYVLFTGITGTLFYQQNYLWSSMMECVNLTRWAEGRSKPKWLSFLPDEGTIETDRETEVEVTFMSTGLEEGVYEMIAEIQLAEEDNRDDLDENLIMISAIMSVGTPIANVTGTITDAANDNPVEGAKLDVSGHYFARFTDENGAFSADNLPLGDYEVTISATDFLTTVEEVSIEEAGDVEWNIELLHSECTPSQRQFFMQLEPGYTHDFEFQIDNGGNGPLTYAVDRRLLGDANAEPFELRQTDEIEDLVHDDMLAGVVFAEDHFFVSGGNNGDNPNKIYVLNTDGEVVDEFNQFVDDRYGMRDLAYDGELIWGAVEGTFYGFTTTGDLEIEFSVDANLEGRALAWDPVDEVLLASDISTDIFAINRDGDVVETYNRPAELRIYGLGVWPDDPEGYYLYVFCRGPDNVGIDAFKLNPESGEYMLAQYFDVGDGRPGGIQITNQLDVYSWVIVSLVQNPDRLNVWQLAARKEWFQITPTAGVIEPDDHEGFVLTLDATGLPVDNDFCGEVVFMHDGIGQETALDVTLSVQEGRVQTTRDIDLHIGWNTISTNLQPNDNENIEGLVDSIVTTGAMIMMKNTNGDFYRPAYDFNNIQAWNSWDGFQMLMAEAATLTIAGESVLKEDPIDLTEGWQLVSYYPRYEIEATVALTTIYDHLIIAKDGYGNFYLPEWDDFSNMGNLCEDQGYFIKVDADCRLVYVPEEEERSAGDTNSRTNIPVCHNACQSVCHEDQIWLSETPRSSTSYSLLLLTEGMETGTRLEAYTPSGALAGRGVVDSNGRCGMALWGNESGFSDGEAITIVGGADIHVCQLELEWLDGDKSGWKADGWGVAKLTGTTELPQDFGIVSAYPNPFNSQMRVSYNLLETGIVDLAAYDVSGRRVAELTSGRQVSGVHTVMFDGKDMPSGVYMLRLQSGGQSSMLKVMLVK